MVMRSKYDFHLIENLAKYFGGSLFCWTWTFDGGRRSCCKWADQRGALGFVGMHTKGRPWVFGILVFLHW